MTTTKQWVLTPEWMQDPFPHYQSLRAEGPVLRVGNSNSWFLSGFTAVFEALRNHEVFSSAGGYRARADPDGEGGLRLVLIADDPPRHTRFRGIVNRAFTPRRIAALEPWIREVADGLLDDIDRRQAAGEAVNVVEALTIPLPVLAIATLLGIPPQRRTDFKRWSDALVGGLGGQMAGSGDDLRDMLAYFGLTAEEKRAHPLDDLISAVATAEVEGDRLADWEVIGFCVLLLVAGNETTTNLMGNMLNVLVDRPDLWQQLREDRSLVEPVIEETLRFDGPVQTLFRQTLHDTELEGVEIPAGADVLVCFGAANHDPAEFPEPEEFRLDRELNRHVAFGMGIHYCLGAPLARAEARNALNAMLDRYPTIERAGEARRLTMTPMLRGFADLPLRLQH